MQGSGRVADAHMSPVFFGYAPQENSPVYDVEVAKQYLADAGFPGGEGLDTLTYITSTGFYPKTREYGQFIVQSLEEIGISVDFQALEAAAWLERLLATDQGHLFDTGWMPPGIDPDLVLRPFFYSGGWVTGYNDPELNELLDRSSTSAPEDRLAIIAEEVLPKMMADMPALPLFTSELITGYQSRVQGFKANPNSTWDLFGVTLAE
jgi:peptide/nickel transport system substrate-binding protein